MDGFLDEMKDAKDIVNEIDEEIEKKIVEKALNKVNDVNKYILDITWKIVLETLPTTYPPPPRPHYRHHRYKQGQIIYSDEILDELVLLVKGIVISELEDKEEK